MFASPAVKMHLVAIIACLLALSSCSPRQQGASSRGFYASGRPNFSITVTEPLSLAHTGFLTAEVPADVRMYPRGSFRFAVFDDAGQGSVNRHAHMILSELPRLDWQWELETWAAPEALSYEKVRKAGKNWTVQILTVSSSKDWFSSLWQDNGRSVPEAWLAKRWSATPDTNVRIVAEYREPAPLCMRDTLAAPPSESRGVPLASKAPWRDCEREILDFSARADAVFAFDRAGDLPDRPEQRSSSLPAMSPDMGKLVGKAESISRDNINYND